jgi:CheY-like chemotaxis protein
VTGDVAMNSRRILLVDDDDTIREVAQLTLEAVGGYQVSTASGGAEGVAKAVAERPDAILLDMMMPGMDGPSAAAQLRACDATREIPVVFLTAKMAVLDRSAWSGLGVVGIIPKPFDPMQLPDQVAAALGWAP